MKYALLTAIILLAACAPQQLATTQSIQAGPLHEPAAVCKRFYLDTRCIR